MISRLIFIRSKISFDDEELSGADFLLGKKTIVSAFPIPDYWPNRFKFKLHDIPSWVEYCETLIIHPEMAAAPPEKDTIYREGGGDFDYEDYYYDRPSKFLENKFFRNVVIEKPLFGQKMLFVNFIDDISESKIERIKGLIRKKIPETSMVWHGPDFATFCFVDNGSPQEVLEALSRQLESEEIFDYLCVQPIEVDMDDTSGISPLEHWIQIGSRNSYDQRRYSNRHDLRRRR